MPPTPPLSTTYPVGVNQVDLSSACTAVGEEVDPVDPMTLLPSVTDHVSSGVDQVDLSSGCTVVGEEVDPVAPLR